jgi:hypothetical protein
MERLGNGMCKQKGDKVRVTGSVKLSAEHTDQKIKEVIEKVEKRKDEIDVVIFGGPTNCLVRHRKESERGFGGERKVKVVLDRRQ